MYSKKEQWLKLLVGGIIALGILLRIAVFLQNRDLFIDEANLARNIYERGYTGLTLPLHYEQYAPPVFLWVVKFFTSVFGFGEMAFRLYSLLAGIAALFVLHAILRRLTSVRSLWYPLMLMAISFYTIRFSCELKQYMPDVLITLSLIWLVMSIDIGRYRPMVFGIIWLLAGSLALWSCMPAIFILPAAGLYYFLQALQKKDRKSLAVLIVVGLAWCLQFAFYYFTILEPQVNSTYLQEFHKNYFLFATPGDAGEWQHNFEVIKNVIGEISGFSGFNLAINLLLIATGTISFFLKDRQRSLLVILPLCLVLVAAALNKYSLIPRVALFTMPLILVLIGYGFYTVLQMRFAAIRYVAVVVACIGLCLHNSLNVLWEPMQVEEITKGLAFIEKSGIRYGSQVYVHNGARPAFIYYTQIHPDRARWTPYANTAHMLWWSSGYDDLMSTGMKKIAFIATSISPADLGEKKETISHYYTITDSLEMHGCHVTIGNK